MSTITPTQSASAPIMAWRDKLAVINEYKMSNTTAVKMFNTTESELQTARGLVEKGLMTIPALTDDDKTKWAPLVNSTLSPTTTPVAATTDTPAVLSSATTPAAVVKATTGAKRGRTGNKIVNALNAIPTTPQPIELFMSTYGISKTILRQSKRFLDAPIKVSIKRDKTTGVEMICRK